MISWLIEKEIVFLQRLLNVTIMIAELKPMQMAQLHSFWNLIQMTDEGVQKELYILLKRKYSDTRDKSSHETPSFLQLQGILKGEGNIETDKKMLDEYLQEKYSL